MAILGGNVLSGLGSIAGAAGDVSSIFRGDIIGNAGDIIGNAGQIVQPGDMVNPNPASDIRGRLQRLQDERLQRARAGLGLMAGR